jgi:acetyl/propionyl-CoA carboxylase alpha subunit/acetyl-CoA carboxylase carboxyltransferase component
VRRLLVANRGEIAVRVLRAASELGLQTVAVCSEDDVRGLHTRLGDEVRQLRGVGPAAYLDAAQLVEVAAASGCDAVHPGYGFLSESADFAERCWAAGITFVGPPPEVLRLFGDKSRARKLAERCDVPVLAGTSVLQSPTEARAFLESLGPGAAVMLKATAGGGGRGMRLVERTADVEEAYGRCRSEAAGAFGSGELYAERFLRRARHVEVQVLGDATGAASHLWERDCSLQRRHQKLVELAPAPGLPGATRERLLEAAIALVSAARFQGIGTVEFLLDVDRMDQPDGFAFIEANPRLQVEHTVTEEVTGVDLVHAQLALAAGRTLAQLGLDRDHVPEARGTAVQVRVNCEVLSPDGGLRPSTGTLRAFEVPAGPGVRVDTCGHAGYRPNPRFDSLVAKVVAHGSGDDLGAVLARAYRALCEFRIEGVATNVHFLQNLLREVDVVEGRLHTRLVDQRVPRLTRPAAHRDMFADQTGVEGASGRAGARVDPDDPLAVLRYGKSRAPMDSGEDTPAEVAAVDARGLTAVVAPLQGTVVSVDVAEGDEVRAGHQLLVMEAMKMEHVVTAASPGTVTQIAVTAGDAILAGHVVILLQPAPADGSGGAAGPDADQELTGVRPDLQEVRDRHAVTLDAARPAAVEQRRGSGQRTARENLDDLCDAGSLVEYAPLVIAAQRLRRPEQELIERTPADGIVAGTARVNGDIFPADRAECAVMAYDYTVLAGTQGGFGHEKMDRIFALAARRRLPLVLFAEGGGGRAGDSDGRGVSGFKVLAFHLYAKLSGLVPLVGIVSGRCFAGNASLLGCADVIIATANSTIGMGGPAMIEGGGLGVYRPEEVGPMKVQVPNGVVDVAVADEAEAVAAARRYLSYFQGAVPTWECADQDALRRLIPENRLRVYDLRRVIDTLADAGSVLELRPRFGLGMITALARVEGRPLGIVANNPGHLAGAIESDGADKAARFMQLCDAFDLPILFLCDTPGIMVGPEAEREALVRHANRMFVVGANLSVPFFTIVLRKCYGLGALTMAGGSSKMPAFVVAWPTGEFGGMGLEGQVKLGYRKELAAIEDPVERRSWFERMVAGRYRHGRALNAAAFFEIDDVIDPAESRRWIMSVLATAPPPFPRTGPKKRPFVDAW